MVLEYLCIWTVLDMGAYSVPVRYGQYWVWVHIVYLRNMGMGAYSVPVQYGYGCI